MVQGLTVAQIIHLLDWDVSSMRAGLCVPCNYNNICNAVGAQ